jgi:NAD-dependent deacetylase
MSHLLVVTGAGISLASGIPTFRGSDPGAVWANDVMDKGTFAYFQRNPAASWQWYRERFLRYKSAKPNGAHTALAELEKHRNLLVVTQNVDTLHEQAGTLNLVKVHGSMDKVRCARVGCKYGAPRGTIPLAHVDFSAFDREPVFKNIPRCPSCNKLLRMHVLWFDEYYTDHAGYEYDRIGEFLLDKATEVWFVGTSMSVGITETVRDIAHDRGLPITIVNPATDAGFDGATHVMDRADVWLYDQLDRAARSAV